MCSWILCGESGPFGAPADLLLQPLHPLVAAVIEVGSLREQVLVPCAGRLGHPCFTKGVLKVLAGEAHHEGAAGSELPRAHGRPAA